MLLACMEDVEIHLNKHFDILLRSVTLHFWFCPINRSFSILIYAYVSCLLGICINCSVYEMKLNFKGLNERRHTSQQICFVGIIEECTELKTSMTCLDNRRIKIWHNYFCNIKCLVIPQRKHDTMNVYKNT